MRRNADFDLLARTYGIVFPGAVDYLPDEFRHDFDGACDAQPAILTTGNSGIPAWLTTYVDPKVIEILVAPMKAAQIIGEAKKGDWLTETAMFPMVELDGEVSSYGDFDNNGVTGANAQFPQRQSFHYQTFVQYGEKEVERMGLAKLDWVGKLQAAAALTMAKYQNKSYFFGITGLVLYGLLNDPNLFAPITPATKTAGGQTWITAGGVPNATANEVFADVQTMFFKLQQQCGGLVDLDSTMKLVMSPTAEVALTITNSFGVSVRDLLKKNFPNLSFETAPEYATTAGQLVQLMVDSVEGQPVASCGFTEKMRSHAVITESSAWKQKKSQGTWGTIVWLPIGISQMLGV